MTHTAFVAGATGYTGRETVRALRERGVQTCAHVRPDSPRLDEWRTRFGKLGSSVDTTPWQADAIQQRLEELRPSLVFALLGTTSARAREEAGASYETVDYALTHMLMQATRAAAADALFVYVSAMGAREDTRNEYLRVRGRIERELRESGLRHHVIRPAFISGDDREESRPTERRAARMIDGMLGVARILGARGLYDRYATLSGNELARGMVRLALAGQEGVTGAAAVRADAG